MGRASRDKGARGEVEVCALLHAHGWKHAHRNFDSGSAGGGDIARGPAGVALEVKRTEALRLREAWRQAQEDADGRGDIPVVLHRWNGGGWLAVLPAEELLALLALREKAA
jgi:hypothetical protein